MIKLVSGWLEISTSMLNSFFLRNFYVQNRQDLLAGFFLKLDFPLFWELGDWLVIFFEIGFLVVVFYPKKFKIFTLFAYVFHALVLLMFNIGFSLYIGLYWLFWLSSIPSPLVEKLIVFFKKFKPVQVVLFAVFISIMYYFRVFCINFDTTKITHLIILLTGLTSAFVLIKIVVLKIRKLNLFVK